MNDLPNESKKKVPARIGSKQPRLLFVVYIVRLEPKIKSETLFFFTKLDHRTGSITIENNGKKDLGSMQIQSSICEIMVAID